jgi:ubiquinone/menaquinone biosynthesis C-methylase UbiE
MAMWLADQVGDLGSVIAVDRDVTLLKHLEERSKFEIVDASIENLDLPGASLDSIHTRNVLMHIDDADEIIVRLVETLRPGGILLMEEADYFPLSGMTSAGLFEVANALVARWTWARTMPNTVARLPVTDIAVTIDTSMLQGGSQEAAFWAYTFQSVEHRLTNPELAASNGLPSVTHETFDDAMALLADDSFWTPFAAVVCVSCRRHRRWGHGMIDEAPVPEPWVGGIPPCCSPHLGSDPKANGLRFRQ